MIELEIGNESHDQRADRYLHKLFDVPKSVVQKWFRNKKVKRNRKALKASDRVYAGDQLELFAAASYRKKAAPVPLAQTREIDIVFENENLMILYKPPGQLSHAAHGKEYGRNVVDAMIAHLIHTGEYVPRIDTTFTPALVNRLDRNTGGLVLGAKNYETLKTLNHAMRNREIGKYYQALCSGSPLEIGVYEGYLEQDQNKLQSRITAKGKYVRLDIMDVERIGNFYLYTIELHTGRTHQIRAQLQALNAPIAGDPKYGDPVINEAFKKMGFRYQYLLAHALEFRSDQPLLSSLKTKTIQVHPLSHYEDMQAAARRVSAV